MSKITKNIASFTDYYCQPLPDHGVALNPVHKRCFQV